MAEPIIHLHNVSKSFGRARGVTDVSLQVPPGVIYGLLGPEGAGKSTVMDILADIVRPTSGTVQIFGFDARAKNLKIRKLTGYAAYDMAMDTSLSGWQQIEYFGLLRGQLPRPYIRELAQRLRIDLKRPIKNMSRVSRQKIALITALMYKPELLLLDEPASGLEPTIQAELYQIIREQKAEGATVFLTSQSLGEAQELCDHVAFIREGEIIADQPIQQLMTGLPMRLRLSSADPKLARELAAFKGVANLRHDGPVVSCTFAGDTRTLLTFLSKRDFTDLSINPADLETIFIKYYKG